jgi:hypothetical protein
MEFFYFLFTKSFAATPKNKRLSLFSLSGKPFYSAEMQIFMKF